MKYVLFPSLALLLFSCDNPDQDGTKADAMDTTTVSVSSTGTGGKHVNTSTGKKINVLEEHPIGMSLSDIKVFGEGMGDTVKFKDADPVKDVLHGDLDKDGFDEVYIVTATAGSGSYGKVIGLASIGDSAFLPVNFPAMEQDAKQYDGYMGGDIFSIEGDALVRTFPLYKLEDNNLKPTGGSTTVRYGLIRKGNKFLLLERNP